MKLTSVTVLEKIQELSTGKEEHPQISIESLATTLDISVPGLIAILTQLEHEDKITMEISTDENKVDHHLNQHGYVRLMHQENV